MALSSATRTRQGRWTRSGTAQSVETGTGSTTAGRGCEATAEGAPVAGVLAARAEGEAAEDAGLVRAKERALARCDKCTGFTRRSANTSRCLGVWRSERVK